MFYLTYISGFTKQSFEYAVFLFSYQSLNSNNVKQDFKIEIIIIKAISRVRYGYFKLIYTAQSTDRAARNLLI